MDGLIVGTLCALVFRESESVRATLKWLSWVASVTLGCFAAGVVILRENPTLVESFVQTVGITLLALGFGTLVLKAAATEGAPTLFQKLLCTRTLRTLGKYSYGIYVIHVPLLGAASEFFVRHSGPHPPNTLAWKLWWCLCLALTTAAIPIIAALSYEYFERPLLSLKRYFEPRFSASPGTVVIGIRENYAAPNNS